MIKSYTLLKEILQISLAILLASIGLKGFLLPNGFLDGGVTGIALIINQFAKLSISWILPLVSIPFFILGWFTTSKRILIKSAISVMVLALVLHFENFGTITEDKLLIAIFGGIFLGAGVGLAIKNGTVLDGSEILGLYVNQNFGISIGTVVLVFNSILFAITALLISVEVAMYSILAFIVSSKVIDFFIEGFENYVGLWIISDKSEQLQQSLLKEIQTGMTVFTGSKGFGSRGKIENVQVIQIILNRIDIMKASKIISSVDENAFIVEFDVNQIRGGVLKTYLSRGDKKTLSENLIQE